MAETTTGYTKTLTLKTSDGDVTFTGGRAYAIQRQLDDNGGLIHFTNPSDDTQTDYYKIDGVSCQACLVATVTAGTEDVEAINTDDELACKETVYVYTPVAVEAGSDPAELGLYEWDADQSQYVATEDNEPAEGKVYYERTEA